MQAYEQQQRELEEKAAAERLAKYAGEISNDAGSPFVGPKDAKVGLLVKIDNANFSN